MASDISLYGDKMLLKSVLMKKLKSYRNFSVKFGVIFFFATYALHYGFSVLNTNHLLLRVDEAVYSSAVFSLIFAVIGYCGGALLGTVLQKRTMEYITNVRMTKRRLLEEQIAIRKAKIDAL